MSSTSGETSSTSAMPPRRGPRSRTNTVSSFRQIDEEEPSPPVMPIRSRVVSAQASAQNTPTREKPGFDFPTKPSFTRNATFGGSTTFEGPTSMHRDSSPASLPRLSRVPTEGSITSSRSGLRSIKSRDQTSDVFGDENTENDFGDYDNRSASPVSIASTASRSASASYTRQDYAAISGTRKMAPPPPPPSRSKKPPPPPPLKRSALSTSEVPFAA